MKFYSLNSSIPDTSFKKAVISGIAPDRGLYFPERIKQLSSTFFNNIEQISNNEIAFNAIRQFVSDDIPDKVLKEIIDKTLDFDFPLVEIEENVSTLELFHGPTMAFKDVGARFMANCLGYFFEDEQEEVTVLVATSGDTGGAVANGFLGVQGIKVIILYPSGKVSNIQEKQLTTLGNNIYAIEVDGTFDDCQNLVKRAFLDREITMHRNMTSANSINVARWLPQMFYFLFAYKQTKAGGRDIVFSVPSGNFGNICAGMIAQKLGLPAKHFVASTNVNDVVPKYMENGIYQPMPSIATISNAMDVGDPSNFIRIQHLYHNNLSTLKENLSSYAFTDETTIHAIKQVYSKTGYVMDPHGAVGYLGLKEYQKNNPGTYGVFLETAHPIKFLDVVEENLGLIPEMPPQIKKVMNKKKEATLISNYDELKSYLMQ
ncbi:threonine synthase [Flagellimonas sp.]|uniref:threonine synthase n=1 Tax=Flagellimonas sp. TaxID=2058762 RepID=UPI003BB1A574